MTPTRILVVDDKAENLYLLRTLLEGHGFAVDLARHGAEALVRARAEPPNLIVSDLLMPVMDGYTLLRHWKADARLHAIPFVVYTATYTEPADEQLAMDLGADAFLLKPAEPAAFVAHIQALLGAGLRAGVPHTPAASAGEQEVLREYSEVLVHKLEEKLLQLEQANLALAADIEARERAEAAVRESEQHHRYLFDQSPIGLALCRMDGTLVYVNPAYARILGRTPEETLHLSYWEITPPRFAEQEEMQLLSLERTGRYGPFEKEYLHRDGHGVPVRLNGLLVTRAGERFIWSSAEDISERKRADDALRMSNQALRILTECNEHMARAETEGELLEAVCALLAGPGRYVMTWVGYAQDDAVKSIRPMALAGIESRYLSSLDLTWADEPLGRGPTGVAIRSGTPSIARNIGTDPAYGPWRDAAVQSGFASSIALPLRVEGRVIGALNVYSAEFDAFDAREAELMSQLADDVAFGIQAIRTRAERQRAQDLLGTQTQVLELIASGAPLSESLTALVRLVESHASGMLGSILLLDEDGVHVRHGAAPSLPASFVAAVDGQPIGPVAGSCGTAAYRKAPVFVEDIATDPLWAAYRNAALPHGLRASWSTPIFDESGVVLGTFAMYYRAPALPQPEHLQLIDLATHTAAIAIGRWRADAALRTSEELFRETFDRASVGKAQADPTTSRFVRVNAALCEFLGYTDAELLQMAIVDVSHPEERAADAVALPRLLRREIPSHSGDRRFVRKDGTVVWGQTSVTALFDSDGRARLLSAVVQDITASKLAEAQVDAANVRLQGLSRRLLDIQEAERRAIARELHDELGQALTAVKINLQTLQRFPTPATPEQLGECAVIVDRVLQNARSLSLNLRPPLLDDLGLLPALRWLADQMSQRTGLRIGVAAELPAARLPQPTELAGFRIVQEALSNVVRHASAHDVHLALAADAEWLHGRVRDDGRGFDLAEARQRARGGASIGLLSMEERATLVGGGVEWVSALGEGTEVHFWLPVTPTAEDPHS